jgi:hypothetical protein
VERDPLFTPEAERVLAEESAHINAEFRKQAIDEALRARGTPVEVTASDVRRARSRFVRRDAPLYPMTAMLLRVYLVIGVLLAIAGIAYPTVKRLVESGDPTLRLSAMMGIAGAVLTLISFMGQYYFRARSEAASRKILERYERDREMEGGSLQRGRQPGPGALAGSSPHEDDVRTAK